MCEPEVKFSKMDQMLNVMRDIRGEMAALNQKVDARLKRDGIDPSIGDVDKAMIRLNQALGIGTTVMLRTDTYEKLRKARRTAAALDRMVDNGSW